MANSFHKIILVGNLGRDGEKRVTPQAQTVVNFPLAVTETWRDKNGQRQEKTQWVNVAYWGQAAEAVHQYLTKGKSVLVEGTASARGYQAKDGTIAASLDVRAARVVLLGGPGGQSAAPREVHVVDELDQAPSDINADDIPF